MTVVSRTQASFAAGEIDPLLAGRLDIRAAQEGCRTLRNVVVQASGGLARRPGTRVVCELLGVDRLIGLETPVGPALVALSAGRAQVVEGDAVRATLATPWTAAQVPGVRWARHDGALLLTHPDVEPQRLARDPAGAWLLRRLAFEAENPDGRPLSRQPFHRFAEPNVAIQATFGAQDPAAPIPPDRTVALRTGKAVFLAEHLAARLRIRGRQVTITNVRSASEAIGRTDQELIDGQPTHDWQEEAYSDARGWPVALAFHQDRLVVGGTRELPHRIWMSRTGAHLDFDPGTGLDDEAIGFALTADRRHEVIAVVPSRQLQILTTAGEWVVSGAPLTPSQVRAELQTGIGSARDGRVPPVVIDGATLFVGATGRELREFLYTDAEQAYQAADLAVLCRHLLADPVDMVFDSARRLLCLVRTDGRVATVTLDRTSNVAAWALQEVAGHVRAAATAGGVLYMGCAFNGRFLLERFEDGLQLDHAVARSAPTPTREWTGLAHLTGLRATVMEGSRVIDEPVIAGGAYAAPFAVSSIVAGVRFAHAVEALPVALAGERGTSLDALYRTLQVTFRVDRTPRLTADAGNGPRVLAPAQAEGLADVTLGALGWRRALDGPPWRIEQDDPAPFTLLATTLELKVNR